jgi:hypothetical protein
MADAHKAETPSVFTAAEEQVNTAWNLRGKPIVAMTLMGEKPKLLWIRSQATSGDRPSHEETLQYINNRWSNVLKRLSGGAL